MNTCYNCSSRNSPWANSTPWHTAMPGYAHGPTDPDPLSPPLLLFVCDLQTFSLCPWTWERATKLIRNIVLHMHEGNRMKAVSLQVLKT